MEILGPPIQAVHYCKCLYRHDRGCSYVVRTYCAATTTAHLIAYNWWCALSWVNVIIRDLCSELLIGRSFTCADNYGLPPVTCVQNRAKWEHTSRWIIDNNFILYIYFFFSHLITVINIFEIHLTPPNTLSPRKNYLICKMLVFLTNTEYYENSDIVKKIDRRMINRCAIFTVFFFGEETVSPRIRILDRFRG